MRGDRKTEIRCLCTSKATSCLKCPVIDSKVSVNYILFCCYIGRRSGLCMWVYVCWQQQKYKIWKNPDYTYLRFLSLSSLNPLSSTSNSKHVQDLSFIHCTTSVCVCTRLCNSTEQQVKHMVQRGKWQHADSNALTLHGPDEGGWGRGAGLQSQAIFMGHIRKRVTGGEQPDRKDLKRLTPNEYESLREKTSLSAMILLITDRWGGGETGGQPNKKFEEVNCVS